MSTIPLQLPRRSACGLNNEACLARLMSWARSGGRGSPRHHALRKTCGSAAQPPRAKGQPWVGRPSVRSPQLVAGARKLPQGGQRPPLPASRRRAVLDLASFARQCARGGAALQDGHGSSPIGCSAMRPGSVGAERTAAALDLDRVQNALLV